MLCWDINGKTQIKTFQKTRLIIHISTGAGSTCEQRFNEVEIQIRSKFHDVSFEQINLSIC